MTSTLATIQPGSFLTLHYRLSGPAGDVVNTFAAAPATLTLGTGELAPALEALLIGLAEGTRTTLTARRRGVRPAQPRHAAMDGAQGAA